MAGKRNKIFMILAAIVIIGTAVFNTFAAPGEENDPLVSKSYVDAQVASVKAATGTTFVVVRVDAGKKLMGEEGTEVIVRSGEATAIDNGQNGVSDLTAGVDLKTGQKAQLDHLLLIPRDDGRGIAAVSELYVMVRGGYTLQ